MVPLSWEQAEISNELILVKILDWCHFVQSWVRTLKGQLLISLF